MIFKCQTCTKRTDDIDAPPCDKGDACIEFKPIQITQVHHRLIKDGISTLLCTGKPIPRGTVALGGIYGLNCIKCRQMLKDNATLAKSQESVKLGEIPDVVELSSPPENHGTTESTKT
jgi:hypothetical protein